MRTAPSLSGGADQLAEEEPPKRVAAPVRLLIALASQALVLVREGCGLASRLVQTLVRRRIPGEDHGDARVVLDHKLAVRTVTDAGTESSGDGTISLSRFQSS